MIQTSRVVEHQFKLINTVTLTFIPGCVRNQHKINTALVDSATSILLLYAHAPVDWAPKQQAPKCLTIPIGQTMTISEMLTLQLPNIPTSTRIAYRAPHVHNNLVAVSALCNGNCEITFDKHLVTDEQNEQTLIR